MEQPGSDKNKTIRRMKKGSGIISAVCILSALIYIIVAIARLRLIMNEHGFDDLVKWTMTGDIVTYGMNSTVMLLASAVFFRISENGCPFIPSNILIVRAIGALMILSGMFSAAFPAVMTGNMRMLVGMINPSGIASGMLVIFISYIMHYAALLQVESDETL